jgi:hypothetical protein
MIDTGKIMWLSLFLAIYLLSVDTHH